MGGSEGPGAGAAAAAGRGRAGTAGGVCGGVAGVGVGWRAGTPRTGVGAGPFGTRGGTPRAGVCWTARLPPSGGTPRGGVGTDACDTGPAAGGGGAAGAARRRRGRPPDLAGRDLRLLGRRRRDLLEAPLHLRDERARRGQLFGRVLLQFPRGFPLGRRPQGIGVQAPVGDRGFQVRGRVPDERRVEVAAPAPREVLETRRAPAEPAGAHLRRDRGGGPRGERRLLGLVGGDRAEVLGLRDHRAEVPEHLHLGVARPELGQRRAEVLPALEARRRVLREGPREDGAELARDRRVVGLRRGEVLVDDLVRDRREVVADEGLPLREELVEHDAEREEIAPPVHLLARHLLRRHVVRRPEELAGLREARGLDLRDAEVRDLHGPVGRDDDVRGLDVAVDDPAPVRVIEGVRDGHRDLRDAVPRERDLLLQELLEILPLDVLHRDEGRLGLDLLADVVDRDDVRVRERSGRLRLAHEPFVELALLVVVLRGGPDRLEGHPAPDDRVAPEVHDAHRSLAELALHLVARELTRGVRRAWIGRQTASMSAWSARRHSISGPRPSRPRSRPRPVSRMRTARGLPDAPCGARPPGRSPYNRPPSHRDPEGS